MFETLVEDSPEEESTLTSKMSVCVCVRVCVCACARVCVREDALVCLWGRRAGLALGQGGGVTAVAPLSLWVFFLLELGNTISSLFGGGTTPDTKENGTDTVQVRPARSQGSSEDGEWGRVVATEAGRDWGRRSSCLGLTRPPPPRFPRALAE